MMTVQAAVLLDQTADVHAFVAIFAEILLQADLSVVDVDEIEPILAQLRSYLGLYEADVRTIQVASQVRSLLSGHDNVVEGAGIGLEVCGLASIDLTVEQFNNPQSV